MLLNIFYYWISFYQFLYVFTIPGLLLILWFWLSYVDRIYLRYKAYQTGKMIKFRLENKGNSRIKIVNDYCSDQINALGEILAGFTDGMLNKDPSLNINLLDNKSSQTTLCSINDFYENKEIQTDIIEVPINEKKEDKILLNDILIDMNNDNNNLKFSQDRKNVYIILIQF